ncbi:MAG: 1-deoxy-D-xylulose-5-phosphate reductoisomerase, partial [Leptospiraceae bacterium]|nr:1-deoxy-D-xylulose-5-phosphate reductoisomerase [Leptospiraceae bacterium]
YKDTKIYYGQERLEEIVSNKEIDIVLTAIVGSVGILPTIAAIKNRKKIAIANKETLVTFGPYIRKLLENYKIQMVPVDSEHNALFQLLENKDFESIRAITLTASGGTFRDRDINSLSNVTVEETLNHPTWKMGPKITVDSAGLINKSLEVIEAHYLFNFPYDKIEVVIHPQSIVHGIVEYIDGATAMYASHPDMIYPIAHSLFYPEYTPKVLIDRKPHSYKNLEFWEPDNKRYPALQIAYECGRKGGTSPAIFNAANEAAVELFLSNKIQFMQIPEKIDLALQKIEIEYPEGLEGYLEADGKARNVVKESVAV